MNVKNCSRCRKLFNYSGIGPRLCPNCIKEDEDKYKIVKEYLYENPGDTITDISKNTGVAVSLIEKFLREGRLEVANGSKIEIPCEICGKSIKTGRYCAECTQRLAGELKSVANASKSESAGRKSSAAEMFYNK